MTTKDVLREGHHELCQNHANSSSLGQCPRSETIKLEGQNVAKSKGTYGKIWSLFLKMSRDNVVRSPSASGETRSERLHCRYRSKWKNHEVSINWVVRKQSSKSETPEWTTVWRRSVVVVLVPDATKRQKAHHIPWQDLQQSCYYPTYQSKSMTVDITEIY